MGLDYAKFGLLIILSTLFAICEPALSWPSVTDHVLYPAADGESSDPFHMVVIGDSIAWGNGLNKEDKYYCQVAHSLVCVLDRPVDVTIYAHSGATISATTGESIDPSLNNAYPTLMDQANNILNKDDVDLILVSGGINDVDLMNILNVYIPAEKIDQRAQSIKDPMKNLLSYLLNECKNAKIIVTNYYPIVSDNSDVTGIGTLYGLGVFIINDALNKNVLDAITIKERLTENSYMFNAGTTTALTNAVLEADGGTNRIAFAIVNFKPVNSYAASETWLWKLAGLKTDDDQFEYRSPLSDDIRNKINAMGHPNREGAKEYARAIEAAYFNLADSWQRKGDALYMQKRYDEALLAYETSLELTPHWVNTWTAKGNTLNFLGRYDDALQAFENGLELDSYLVNAWQGKGNALFMQNRYDEALQAYEKAIELDPNLADGWNRKGNVLSMQGKYDEAIIYLEEAIRLKPEEGIYWSNKGNTLRLIGKYNEADTCYAKAKELGYIDPGYKTLVNTNK